MSAPIPNAALLTELINFRIVLPPGNNHGSGLIMICRHRARISGRVGWRHSAVATAFQGTDQPSRARLAASMNNLQSIGPDGSTLYGFMIPKGSSAALIRRMVASSAPPRHSSIMGVFTRPIPCSAEKLPSS